MAIDICINYGLLRVRLLQNQQEIEQAQRLRYRVFVEEMNAYEPNIAGMDWDEYDALCDHMCVFDLSSGREEMCGTYRLLRTEALQGQKFYTSQEFNIAPILKYDGKICELGRSCVLKPYRIRPVIELLWRGIASYIFHYNIGLMFGCASFQGNNSESLMPVLALLHQKFLCDDIHRPTVIDSAQALHVNNGGYKFNSKEEKQMFLNLPPLIKGYLRLGGRIGQGAYIDNKFNSIDVCIIVETKGVTARYYDHYARHAG